MISPHPRHRRAAEASTPQQDIPDSRGSGIMRGKDSSRLGTQSTGREFSSYFSNVARRWWGKSHRETDTLLPTTFASMGDSSPPRRNILPPSAKNCNSFLMGGNYYPGKDKKRRHMRRRTLWYRVFCSSNWRKIITFFVLTYLLVWHVLVPFGGWVVHMGVALSNKRAQGAGNWLLYDATLKIPSETLEQKISLELAAHRARIPLESQERNVRKSHILEQIVPRWFHRNDQMVFERQGADTDTSKEDTPDKPDAKQEVHPVQAADVLPLRTIHSPINSTTSTSKCPANAGNMEVATTLVTQSSVERLWLLQEAAKRWKGPIVVVVFVGINEKLDAHWLSLLSNVQVVEYHANEEESKPGQYPVNHLRNLGLDTVKTSHILVVDIDFVPSVDLDKTIASTLELTRKYPNTNTTFDQALVVPAFERIPPKPCDSQGSCSHYLAQNSSFLPGSFTELQTCVHDMDCIVFQSNNNWEGHYSTKSARWLAGDWYQDEEHYHVHDIPCFHTARYEPYVVVDWCTGQHESIPRAPYYDERFHGYGKNKIEWISHLRKRGYRFQILPEGFLVHHPHPESVVKEEWNDRDGSTLHTSMDQLYAKFLQELDHMYQDIHADTIKLCSKDSPNKQT
eukprot:Nitzschia sp. Nitz4//scaffold57_size113557//48387//50258//NITZ4_003990-RA/size113557-processed-gene-0.156-mRNA-1//-1//CDS//3329554843//5140//frame0